MSTWARNRNRKTVTHTPQKTKGKKKWCAKNSTLENFHSLNSKGNRFFFCVRQSNCSYTIRTLFDRLSVWSTYILLKTYKTIGKWSSMKQDLSVFISSFVYASLIIAIHLIPVIFCLLCFLCFFLMWQSKSGKKLEYKKDQVVNRETRTANESLAKWKRKDTWLFFIFYTTEPYLLVGSYDPVKHF